jgi:hypothetical protein
MGRARSPGPTPRGSLAEGDLSHGGIVDHRGSRNADKVIGDPLLRQRLFFPPEVPAGDLLSWVAGTNVIRSSSAPSSPRTPPAPPLRGSRPARRPRGAGGRGRGGVLRRLVASFFLAPASFRLHDRGRWRAGFRSEDAAHRPEAPLLCFLRRVDVYRAGGTAACTTPSPPSRPRWGCRTRPSPRSGAVVRTTHLTGVVTDMGLEGVQYALWLWTRRPARQAGDPGVAGVATPPQRPAHSHCWRASSAAFLFGSSPARSPGTACRSTMVVPVGFLL